MRHACNAEYRDRNYGGIFIVFDRMSGTFGAERDGLPCCYGQVKPLRSNNPVIIAFHEWAALGSDLWQSPSWRAPGRPDRTSCDNPAISLVTTPTAHDAGQKVSAAVG